MLDKIKARSKELFLKLFRPSKSIKEHMGTPVASCQISALVPILSYYLGDKKGYFVEVGAFDGISFSNTYHLATAGWQGIYCEAVREYALKCAENHASHPSIRVLEAAISDVDNSALEIVTGGVFSTSNMIAKNYFERQSFSSHHFSGSERIRVPTLTLASLIKQSNICEIDLLVIDVEGHELSVLKGLDIAVNKPALIIVELQEVQHSHDQLSSDYALARLMLHYHGYICVYADLINTIFVEENLYRLKNRVEGL